MKKIYILFGLLIWFGQTFSQVIPSDKKTGILSIAGVNIKLGLAMVYFRSFPGTYEYPLQPDASVKERVVNRDGTALAIVSVIPFDNEGAFNFLLNLSLKEFTSAESGSTGFLDSQTPFGVGFAIYPFPKARFFGICIMSNFGKENRMRADAISQNYFPIADHKDLGLKVGANVPDALLSPFYDKVSVNSVSCGLTLRF